MKSFFVLMCLACSILGSWVIAEEDVRQNMTETTRDAKLKRQFSFLQVINFPNNGCPGTGNRNGTCYTSDECLNRRGTASGSCANGFGVCCVFSLLCGQTSSENCTFLTLSSTGSSTLPTNCVYTLCENNPNICRIRLDFLSFTIAGPITGSVVAATAVTTLGGGIGDCTTDSFVLNAPGNKGSPTICGVNTGQHMIVDSSTGCAVAAFSFGSASTITRNYDIKVTQFSCQDEVSGPPDCLQYFSGATGTIKSYNFAFTAAPVTSTATHLSNQCYSICIRRASGSCGICFSPTFNPTPTTIPAAGLTNQGSFGLSVTVIAANGAVAMSVVDSRCSSDYLIIPNANTKVIAATTPVVRGNDRFCGRFFNVPDINGALQTSSATLCTTVRPFKIIFKTDANEVTSAATDATTNELNIFPGGIIGFSLDYFQIGC